MQQLLFITSITNRSWQYRKIPKISLSMYKPLQIIISPQTSNAKNPLLNYPSKYKPPGACTWKMSNYKATPIDFETQISLHI